MKTKQSSAVVEPITKVHNTLDFSNKVLYVGIDVHKKRWQAAVFLEGIILSNVSIAASADGLVAYLRKHYGNAAFHCVYECGPWALHCAGNCGRQVWSALLLTPTIYPAPTGKGAAKPIP